MMLEHRPAGFRPRAVAAVIDFLLIAAYALLLFGLATIVIQTTDLEEGLDSPLTHDLLAFVTLILPVILYFTLQESSARQATFGKRRAGLQVVSAAAGGRLSLPRALLRSALKFLPWQMAHTAVFQLLAGEESPLLWALSILAQLLVVVYLLTLWLDRQHRTPYDRLAGTAVVHAPRPAAGDGA